jgi:predicted porin
MWATTSCPSAFDYTGNLGGWSLEVGGGGEWAFTQYTPAGATTADRPQWYQGGIQLGYGHFTIGASAAYYVSYAHGGYAATTASAGDDGWVASAGGSYILDAWSFGLQGVYASFQQSALAILDTSALGTSVGNEDLWGVSVNARYALGPGVSFEGQIAYTTADYGTFLPSGIPVPIAVGVDASRVHSWEIDLGTAIDF